MLEIVIYQPLIEKSGVIDRVKILLDTLKVPPNLSAMTFEAKLAEMGFQYKITPQEGSFRVELIDLMNGYKTVVSKVSGIPNIEGAREILGLMAHKHRMTYKPKKSDQAIGIAS